MEFEQSGLFSQKLSDKEFKTLSEFIFDNYGIKMPYSKKVMLEGRLYKRLRENNFSTFSEYLTFVFSPEGAQHELIHMIDVVTTNKTDFFRESHHFEFLTDQFLPNYNGIQGDLLKIWSAGCSTGEEPYTISICLEEYNRISQKKIKYSITGTDLSTRVLQNTAKGIYNENRVQGIPLDILKRYFLKSIDRENPTVRIIPQLRSKLHLSRVNFMDDEFPIGKDFDVLFCRNVIIYFEKETQREVLQKLCSHLKTGGVFFIGHSESITDFDLPLKQIKPTIYLKV